MMSATLVLGATAALCAAFGCIYLLARRIDNYGIVDVAWAYAFAMATSAYALLGTGWPLRRALIAALVCTWSLRLGTHLYRRVMGHHPTEDGRYQRLRRDWARNFVSKMAGFFQLQAISVVLLAIPFLIACLNPATELHWLELSGTLLWLLALTGEATADRQLATFKRNPANRDRVCMLGLWRLSRHPNYFFEWLVWVAYFIFALASPWGWLAVISPAAVLYLLLRVTGIPLTEEQAAHSKGNAYREYQRTTSAFVPWFPKPSAKTSAR